MWNGLADVDLLGLRMHPRASAPRPPPPPLPPPGPHRPRPHRVRPPAVRGQGRAAEGDLFVRGPGSLSLSPLPPCGDSQDAPWLHGSGPSQVFFLASWSNLLGLPGAAVPVLRQCKESLRDDRRMRSPCGLNGRGEAASPPSESCSAGAANATSYIGRSETRKTTRAPRTRGLFRAPRFPFRRCNKFMSVARSLGCQTATCQPTNCFPSTGQPDYYSRGASRGEP